MQTSEALAVHCDQVLTVAATSSTRNLRACGSALKTPILAQSRPL